MKKILFSAASALALAGVAVAADSTEFGVLYVPSTAKETIVAVPWLASNTGSVAVAVADLVLTAGLQAGAELKYYAGSSTGYQVWTLVEDSETHVKSWQPGTTVSEAKVSESAGASDATIKRGQAILLSRAETSIESGFYIMGKPSSAEGRVDLNQGYTLVAPPFVTDTDPNNLTWVGINGKTDTILVPQSDGSVLALGYKASGELKGKWVKWNGSAFVVAGTCIPAGTGMWFKTEESVSGKYVSWAAQ